MAALVYVEQQCKATGTYILILRHRHDHATKMMKEAGKQT
jgi:hypothetical protein